MKIQINQHYIYENNLVKVIGMSIKNNPDKTLFLVEWFVWADGKDTRHTKEVPRRELQEAPTMERLYYDYRMALDVICQQANRIEELEASRDLWQAEALRLRATTDDIPF